MIPEYWIYNSKLGDNKVKEYIPLMIEESSQFGFLIFCNGSEFDCIQAQLLEVSDVQVPREEGVKVVESHAFVAHEAGVVWRYGNWNALMEERSGWVAS